MSRIVVFPVVIDEEDKDIDNFLDQDGLEVLKRIKQTLQSKGVKVQIEGPMHRMHPVILGRTSGKHTSV